MSDTPPFKLTLDDMEVKVLRTFRLSEPTRVDTKSGTEAVLATILQVTETTYSFGTTETDYQVRGRELKADGTPDDRKGARWFTMFGPLDDRLPDPRKPFIEALHDLADEKGL